MYADGSLGWWWRRIIYKRQWCVVAVVLVTMSIGCVSLLWPRGVPRPLVVPVGTKGDRFVCPSDRLLVVDAGVVCCMGSVGGVRSLIACSQSGTSGWQDVPVSWWPSSSAAQSCDRGVLCGWWRWCRGGVVVTGLPGSTLWTVRVVCVVTGLDCVGNGVAKAGHVRVSSVHTTLRVGLAGFCGGIAQFDESFV
jgi:hypothetical protein